MDKTDVLVLAHWIADGSLALVHCGELGAADASQEQRDTIVTALRRLAAAEPGEPVAWIEYFREDSGGKESMLRYSKPEPDETTIDILPLYTRPNPDPAFCEGLVADAVERIKSAIADLEGEHEVMAGSFDPSKWKIDISVTDLQTVVSALTQLRAPAPQADQNADRMREALEKIAGSHWERIGRCQTDVEEVPDLSAEEAMLEARKALTAARGADGITSSDGCKRDQFDVLGDPAGHVDTPRRSG